MRHRGDAQNNVRTSFEKDVDLHSGMKASPYTNKKGLFAEIDKKNVLEKAKQKLAAYGSGVSRWAMVKADGTLDKEAIYENEGLIFKPNQKGVFGSIHEAFLKDQLEKEEQINNYVKKVIKYLVNDRTNAMIFSLEDDEYNKIFGPSDSATLYSLGITMEDDIAKLNCKASYMQILLPESAAFHASSMKLFLLTRHFMPMIALENETQEKDMGEPGVTLNPISEGQITGINAK